MGEAVEKGSRDLYAVLGVAPRASADDIRAAFRSLAAKYHPDRNPNDPKAATHFKRVNAAYQVLSDSSQRTAYDRLTQVVDEEEIPSPRPANPKPTPPSKPERREANAHSTSPPPEREVLRDDRIVVTDRRVQTSQRAYDLRELAGVQLIYDGRNHFHLLFSGITLVIVAVAASTGSGRWTWFATLGIVGLLIRYLAHTTRYSARLRTTGGEELDLIESTSAAWAADVVRAIDAGIAQSNPRGCVR